MTSEWTVVAGCVVVGVPALLGLCLLILLVALRLARPTLLTVLHVVGDIRDREHQFALARMERQIELAKVHRGRADHVRAA